MIHEQMQAYSDKIDQTRSIGLKVFVIRIKLKQLLDDKSFAERRRITLKEVSEATGVSRPTLNRIANTPGYNTNTDTVSSLCDYFDCEPGDLLVRVRADDEAI